MGSKDYHLERMEFHRKELEKIMEFGDDDFDIGTVIYFEKCFVNRGQRSKSYKYVALKSLSNGAAWYTCGPRAPGPYTWDQLVAFMSEGVDRSKILFMYPEITGMSLTDYRLYQQEATETRNFYEDR